MEKNVLRDVNSSEGETREEHDFLGTLHVPLHAYYGVQTLRATENFPITGFALSRYPHLIRAYGFVKQATARVNVKLGLLDEKIGKAIDAACADVIANKLDEHFVVDLIQGGAGTSTNMNFNEVIANRALEILGYQKGQYEHVHPNNHVNMSQSTNDTYPTSIHLAILLSYRALTDAMSRLRDAFRKKADEFACIVKMGRTQLQDAVPMFLGQEFAAFATTIDEDIDRVHEVANLFKEINIGATAIGTGINTAPGYAEATTKELSALTDIPLVLAGDLIEATSDTGPYVQFSSALRCVCVKLTKICNDLRLLNSGPGAGFGDISLPAMQPGSTIMPGKVNPVIPEAVNQVAFCVMGNDQTVMMAAAGGQLQLNAFEPIIIFKILESIELLTRSLDILTEKCVLGIQANEKRVRRHVEKSVGIVTALSPYIGYENATRVVRLALESDRSVIDIVREEGLMSAEELKVVLAVENMVRPTNLIQSLPDNQKSQE